MPSSGNVPWRQSRPVTWLAVTAVALLLSVAAAASVNAWRSFGAPFPGLFVDPYADFSNVSMPAWAQEGLPLRYPDRLVAIEGQALPRAHLFPSQTAAARIAALARDGATEARLTFSTSEGPREVRRPLLELGTNEVGFFFGFYAVVALFLLWTGGVVLVMAGHRPGARAYAAWTVGAYLLFLTFYDYHTTARLPAAFSLGGVGFDLGFLWLAYAFPEPPKRGRAVLRTVLLAVTAWGVGAAVWMVAAPWLGHDASTTRQVVGQGVPASMAVLLLSILLRLGRGSGRERAELLSAAWGLAAAPATLAVGFFVALASGSGVVHLFVPFVIPLLPLSVGFALVRHNILETDVVLSRRLLAGPIGLASLGGALLAWLALRLLVREGVETWLPTLLSVPVLVGGLMACNRLTLWLFFPAASQFRPSIEQLSDQLSSLHELPAIRQAVEAVVSRWLPTSGPVRVLEARVLTSVPHLPEDALERLNTGQHVWTLETPWQRLLVVPMRSLGRLRGVLLLPPKHQAALYTSEDLTLLATIASLGAVSLHHAEALKELEALRRSDVEATRDEKRFTLGLLGAEMSHEIAYPLNFFRYLLKRSGKGHTLEPQDVEIGSEEVARLERMLATLRKLKSPAPQLAPVPLVGPLKRALELIREPVEEKRLSVSVEVPEDLLVLADPDMVLQVFANLLRNGAQAVDPGGRLGVSAALEEGGIQLKCWDSGPGVPEALRDSIWNPWVTTKEGGSGLGLAITQRLVSSLGWRISLERKEEHTCFCIHVPDRALLTSPAAANSTAASA
ncbi:HAMP domain-containing histidine kinase [Corallococcus exiguus]|uniref:sensor histidine kinase n=1 Tax=Corallococcus sp. AB018 TaxID=2316715 RepID=UPI0013151798|nr:HAMP domain-containing sensor histidine kinase [Corallococcus sp. AB018]NNC18130.1 HAMP domain-containing histidine kinase [Corallococcus exiguus]